MDEFSLIREAADSLREYGFNAEIDLASSTAVDGKLVLERHGVRQGFPLEVKLPLTLNTVDRHASRDVLYITDRVSTKTAEALRRMGVHFIDAAGNAFLANENWYLDVRGRRRQGAAERQYSRGEAPSNLYSAKRAQVVFALLTWPELLDASVRAVAEAAGASIGIAQSTTNELRRRGLWPDHEAARWNLIDGWVSAFPETLGRSLKIRSVRAEQLETFFGPVLASGEIAPSVHMRASSGVVYVDELSTELMMMNRWRVDGPPNLIVRRRFWSYSEGLDGEAPPLLVYGDLQSSDDPRVRSVAGEFRSRL